MSKEQEQVHVNVVAYDETHYYELDCIPHGEKIDKIFGVYLYERDVHTYCCSSTPMYFMQQLRASFVLKEEYQDNERVKDDINEALIEGCYSTHYQKIYSVDKYIENNPDMAYVDEHCYEPLNDAIEFHQSNHYVA